MPGERGLEEDEVECLGDEEGENELLKLADKGGSICFSPMIDLIRFNSKKECKIEAALLFSISCFWLCLKDEVRIEE